MRKRVIRGLVIVIPVLALVTFGATRSQEGRRLQAKPPTLMQTEAARGGEGVRPDHPNEALQFRLMQQRNEQGQIPDGALLRAASHREAMVAAARDRPSAGGISSWTWLGPGNIGGRIRSIVIHPTTPQTMWVGSVTGGIFKTTNGGASWAPLDDFMANLAVSTLVSPASTPNVLYAGTGEGNGPNLYPATSEFGNRGAGVFKSSDGGMTWSQLASTNDLSWWYVNRLAIDPNAPNTLLAATWSGIWRTTDGGTTWTGGTYGFANPYDIDFHATDSSRAVAGGFFGLALYSTDGGQSWNEATGISGGDRVEVAYAPNNPLVVYASVDQNNGSLYRSTNGGQSYTLVNNTTGYLGAQGNYDNVVWVDPTNSNTVVVGGIDLWRSTNAGSTLTKISAWESSPSSAHADHHAIVHAPGYNGTSNRTVFFGNDGGIYKATDVLSVAPLSGWQELNNNLGITQFYGAAANNSTGKIIGGTQDNGTLLYSGGTETWTDTFGGDGGYSAADQTNSNYFYGEYVYANVHRSSDGGASAEFISGQYWNGSAWVWKADPYRIPDAQNSSANFIAPFVLDPNNANRLLVGGASLWRTNDARTANTNSTGPSWASIKGPIFGDAISAVTVQSGNSNVVYVGYNSGFIYKSTNATSASPTWTRIDTPDQPSRMVLRITIDPTNANVVYATFGGFEADNVWRSSDGGATWSPRVGSGLTSLPAVPVRTLAVNATNTNWIYVGTEIGVFVSEDAGLTWSVPNDGPANVPVDELFWKGTDLVAATYGRGLFKSTPGAPTAVGLLRFTAVRTVRGVLLRWRAAAEPRIVGFEVYRNATKLNRRLVAAKPGPGASSYMWLDRNQARVARYSVVAVHVDGTRRRLGSVRFR